MKKILIIFLVFCSISSYGQQLPQQTQYMFNQYAFNPAYAGVKPYWESVMNSRYQWIGIVDAPRTLTLTAHGPLRNQKMAVGGMVYNDIVGPTRRLGFQGSYAYHIKLTSKIKLSLGASLGFNQWLVDADKIAVHDENDPFFENGLIKSFSPDAKFAFYLYHEDWFFGAASPQLLHNKLNFQNAVGISNSFLENHFYFNGGYKFHLGSSFTLEPTALLKYVRAVPPKIDINLTATYKNTVWLGVGYRTQDAILAMVGYNHKNNLKFGYSYDFSTTNLQSYNTGSHELFFAIKFAAINKADGDKLE
ncbi:MAG: type IX secretion system membrane protein PorP/SprF [Crocinitomicaceae bacterium]